MRIVQVSTLYPPEFFSGGTLAAHHVARGLKRRGHDVFVFAGSAVFGEPVLSERGWTFEEIPVHAINVTPGYARGVANYRNLSVAERFERYVEQLRPDVVHFHSIQALGADILSVPHRHGAKCVLTMHDAWFICERQFMFVDPPVRRICPRRVHGSPCACGHEADLIQRREFLLSSLRDVDRVLAVSEPFAELLRENGIPSDRLVVSENGLVPPTPTKRTPSARVRFGHLAGPDAWKGSSTIAAAMQRLDRDVILELHGVEQDAWRAMGGSWPDRRVRLRPRFRPSELPELLANLDVVLVTSLGIESFSIVAREALQYGLPVISSRCLGPEGVIRDGENGLLYERDDASGLSDAMRRLADDPALLDELRRGAAATHVRSIDEQVEQIEGVYKELEPAADRHRIARPRPKSVLFLAGMDGAPFRYRVANVAHHLAAHGVQTTVRFNHDEDALNLAGDHDVVVLNRVPWDAYVERVVARARRAGAVLVFGVDDLIFDPDLDITALAGLPRKVARDYRNGLKLFRRTLRACDAFLGSTPVLVESARQLGVPALLHGNYMSADLIQLSERARQAALVRRESAAADIRIGYFSGSFAHDRDFAVAAPALTDLLESRPQVHLVLGGHLRVPEAMRRFEQRIERLPFVTWRELPALIAAVDVNIAPLEIPSVFNDAKSVLKWFESGACGVPTIASASQPYRDSIRHGVTGMLASSTDEWSRALFQLVDEPDLRHRLAENARQEALVSYGPDAGARSIERVLDQLGELRGGPLRVLPRVTPAELERVRALGISIGRPATEPENAQPGPAQLEASGVTPAIVDGTGAYQPLFFADGWLRRVDLMVGTYGRLHRYDLELRVLDLASGEELASALVQAEHACDNTWLAFDFEPVRVHGGRQVLFALESRGAGRHGGLSLYCKHEGWPTGAGWSGAMRGINLTYRTWMLPTGAASASEPDERNDMERLRARLAASEARLASLRAAPTGLEAVARRSRIWRAGERLLGEATAPGLSLPARVVRRAVSVLKPDAGTDEFEHAWEAVRMSLPYRVGRRAYRSIRRR